MEIGSIITATSWKSVYPSGGTWEVLDIEPKAKTVWVEALRDSRCFLAWW